MVEDSMEQLTQFVNKSFENCDSSGAMRIASLVGEAPEVSSDVKQEQTCLDLFKIKYAVKSERQQVDDRLLQYDDGLCIRRETVAAEDEDIGDDVDDDEDDEIDIDNVPEEEEAEEERRNLHKVERFDEDVGKMLLRMARCNCNCIFIDISQLGKDILTSYIQRGNLGEVEKGKSGIGVGIGGGRKAMMMD
ncbi:hypothetical protein PoB_000043800 [Plakobranchus ocellatus]|uniref:Uncharacterized protein n=1 Tax=Plakobranchus ocellatus TaxID=259542 RepID=A0AAV3XUE0_9GAST|nr:hypothetical protein PoB_000043800 [Plakobranchus ocellatus]